MDQLTRYAADVIEFIAGGILFLTALLIWGYLWIPGPLDDVVFAFAKDLGEISSIALGIGLLGITYTLGVFAEGASRVATEWRLRSLTWETMQSVDDRPPPADVEKLVDARLLEAGRLTYAGAQLQLRPCRPCRGKISARRRPRSAPDPSAEKASLVQDLCDTDRTKVEERVHLRLLEEKREKWRSVAAQTTSGAKAVDAQLKRLRIERTFLLSIVLITLAFAAKAVFDPGGTVGLPNVNVLALWALTLSGAILAAACAYLVNERFRRFLDTIARAHDLEVAST